jgi:hypothetical protein
MKSGKFVGQLSGLKKYSSGLYSNFVNKAMLMRVYTISFSSVFFRSLFSAVARKLCTVSCIKHCCGLLR